MWEPMAIVSATGTAGWKEGKAGGNYAYRDG